MNKTLVIRPGEFIFDREGYNYTKVVSLKCYSEGRQKIVSKQPTTWASLIREVIKTYYYEIDRLVERNYSEFEFLFNSSLDQMLRSWGGRTNTSFSEKLFTFPINAEREIRAGNYPEHLHSALYKNNANSLLKIFEIPDSTEAEYITAVYSGEVVWVLNALITALEEFDPMIEIEYFKRDNAPRERFTIDGQVGVEDIPSDNEDAPELEDDVTEIKGNANLYITLLKLKVDELYSEDKLNQEDFDKMMGWIDKIATTIIDTKSVLNMLNLMTKDLNEKYGV